MTAQRQALLDLGVAEGRIYTDHGLTGANRARPGLDQALAAVRATTGPVYLCVMAILLVVYTDDMVSTASPKRFLGP